MNVKYFIYIRDTQGALEMLFSTDFIKSEDISSIQNFIQEFDEEINTVSPEEIQEASNVSKYISSLVSGCYQKSIEDIENTKVGNKLHRKRTAYFPDRLSFQRNDCFSQILACHLY